MIEIMTDLPDHVLGLRARGQVSADDYREVLVPALEKKLKQHPRVRLLYVIGEGFEEYTRGAAWEDAKVGMFHLTAFERTAIVTDVDWVEKMVKALGFAMPGQVRLFEDDELQNAREWICEPLPVGDLEFDLLQESGILILHPHGKLEAGDFARLGEVVDPYIAKAGGLKGLMIEASSFPGWDDFAALTSHIRFVKDHQANIRRVAFVSDAQVLSAVPKIASMFVSAEVRSFPASSRDEALLWLGQS